MTRLPRTIRLDPSDGFVFAAAAEPGEWAVVGTFLFWAREIERLHAKERTAFRAGFLGIASFGHSTLVTVTEAEPEAVEAAAETLARQLMIRLGAPDLGAALAAAREEIAAAASICEGHAPGTLIAMRRSLDPDGRIREQFRTLRPRDGLAGGHARAFAIVETDDEGAPGETLDIADLARGAR